MSLMFCLSILLVLCLTVKSQSSLGSCDFSKFAVNGCEDEFGADCDSSTMTCRCKTGFWHVLDNTFCFPTQCPKGQFYEHNLQRCDNQRKASLNSLENYCKYDYHCRGANVRCLKSNEWNHRCVCNRGFTYDPTTEECQRIQGVSGFCDSRKDCDETGLRNLVCIEHTCQCSEGFTYNVNIDGCEDNRVIEERDSETRKMIYLFIGLGLFFGTALSLKFHTSSASATQQLLLKRVLEQRQQERELERQKREQRRLQEQGGEALEMIVVDHQEDNKSQSPDKLERLIDRETA